MGLADHHMDWDFAVTNAFAQEAVDLQSHAEISHFEETSRYADILQFFSELQKRSPLVRLETFGLSQEGRRLPLVILSDPPLSTPREASNKEFRCVNEQSIHLCE